MDDDTTTSVIRPRDAVTPSDGPLRPFLLVPGTADEQDSWVPVARQLQAAGHAVLAVAPGDEHPDRRADDLAVLIGDLGWTGGRAPVAVGRSRGGSVVVSLAARRAVVAAVGCLGDGWSRTSGGFDPQALLPHVDVPALLSSDGRTGAQAASVEARMPRSRVRWFPGGATEPPRGTATARVTDSLLALASEAEPRVLV